MKAEKRIIDRIDKCYAVTEFTYDGERRLLCSAEGKGPCNAYDLQGNLVETLWREPGGVMTLLQLPDASQPILLATQGFFSPDNAAGGKLVYYYRMDGRWVCETLCELPFVHRFGIMERKGKKYLVAATLKSASAFEGDWTCPGRVWTAPLPENIFQYGRLHPLQMQPICNGLYKNHGFCINQDTEGSYAVVGTDNGVYTIFPPEDSCGEWSCERILDVPVSDMLYQDLDGDGEKELLILTPFHGEDVKIFKKEENGSFVKVYEREKKLPFAHAIWGETIEDRAFAFLGGRGGERELIAISFDEKKGEYTESLIDKGAGAANCMVFRENKEVRLLAANRETDEVAVYSLLLS